MRHNYITANLSLIGLISLLLLHHRKGSSIRPMSNIWSWYRFNSRLTRPELADCWHDWPANLSPLRPSEPSPNTPTTQGVPLQRWIETTQSVRLPKSHKQLYTLCDLQPPSPRQSWHCSFELKKRPNTWSSSVQQATRLEERNGLTTEEQPNHDVCGLRGEYRGSGPPSN